MPRVKLQTKKDSETAVYRRSVIRAQLELRQTHGRTVLNGERVLVLVLVHFKCTRTRVCTRVS